MFWWIFLNPIFFRVGLQLNNQRGLFDYCSSMGAGLLVQRQFDGSC